MELIEKLASMLASLMMSTAGGGGRALHQLLELILFITILITAAFARPIALRIAWVRRLLDPGERFAGRYVQIINSAGERRYSTILDIRYRSHRHGYFLSGVQYDTEGRRAIDFDSENVAIREGQNSYLEFAWRAETVTSKERFDGYTQMKPDNSDNLKRLEGRGFFITFHHDPKRFDLRFIKLTRTRLRSSALRTQPPNDSVSSL
jgi:hypothetical protein